MYRYLSSNYYSEPDDLPPERLRCESCRRFLPHDTKPTEYKRLVPVFSYDENGDKDIERWEPGWTEQHYLCERCRGKST